jgi:hypothetical protein
VIDFLYIEAAIFVFAGGIMFALALDNLIPFFGLLTVLYVIFLFSALATTYLIGKRRGAP